MASFTIPWRIHLWMVLVTIWPLVSLPLNVQWTPIRLIPVLLAWYWGVYNIVWQFYFGPHSHIPLAPGGLFALGHGLTPLETPPGRSTLKWAQVPNDGLVRANPFFHCGYRLLVCTPEVAMQVLNTHAYDYEKPRPPKEFLRRVIGQGLLLSEGDEHKAQRKIIWPAFQGQHIKQLAPTFWAKSVECTDAISAELALTEGTKSRTGVVEMGNFASRATLDIIGIAGLGRDFQSLQNATDELADLFSTLTDPSDVQMLQCFFLHIFLPRFIAENFPSPANRVLTKSAARLREICLAFVRERKQQKVETDQSKDILSILVRSGALSESELVDQLLTFLAAGHETTASALTWTTYALAINPDVQTRLRKELRQTLPANASASQISADLLDSMPYLSAVCNESLRLFATVPITSRVALRDTMIGDVRVPKNSLVILSPSAVNKLPKLWGDDADKFNPDRWMAPDQASLGGSASPYSQITFLHGPRSCIGQSFAKLELKALVAAIVDRFDIEMADPNEVVKPAGIITIKPEQGLHVRLTELTRS